jgi:NAD(P)-dependent dehydrogenase (short-subunit alcohol dehydrogenase family)
MNPTLEGKVAMVTGGSRGIGYACASILAEQGAQVFLGASDPERLRKASETIQEKNAVKIGFHASDLRSMEGCKQTAEALIQQFKRCDILINSAGATRGGLFPEQPDEEMVDGFALKFHSAARLSRLLWPELTKTNGSVINIVGGFSRTPSSDFMVGGAVNAALGNFSKALANQGLKDDVNVNWIHPGMTVTERLQETFETRARQQNLSVHEIQKNAVVTEGLRRLGEPEDVAELVAFLCSPQARHIHGTGISVDGGGSKGYY